MAPGMLSRLNTSARMGALAAILAAVATFLTWYEYPTVDMTVRVNGFRSSVVGDLFFLSAMLMLTVVLHRAGVAESRTLDLAGDALFVGAGATAAGAMLISIVLATSSSRTPHSGIVVGTLAGAVMAASAILDYRTRQMDADQSDD